MTFNDFFLNGYLDHLEWSKIMKQRALLFFFFFVGRKIRNPPIFFVIVFFDHFKILDAISDHFVE